MRILNKEIINKENTEVELMGWVATRRDHGKIIFIDLRDRSGVSQLVFTPKNEEAYKKAETLRPELVIRVVGRVNCRPKGSENPDLETGDFEIEVKELDILVEAQTLPFTTDTDGYEIGEEVRMRYRYIDLKRKRLQDNLRARAKIEKHIRDFLTKKDFVEIETPILGKSTPEGARDYLVPSRLQPGNFYALPQSPQQYKQLLMVAGLEKYFQIARCFRDEDTRGDRQPEFTQLDLEMSFVSQKDILLLIEKLYLDIVRKLYRNKKLKLDKRGKITRMSYQEAMEKYKSDKPDIRDNKEDPNELAFVFIDDFPMFEEKKGGSLGAVHHPFTLPTFNKDDDPYDYNHDRPPGEEMRSLLQTKNRGEILNRVRAFQYDFVCNGYEIGGGSLRTHDWGLLSLVFEFLGYSNLEIKDKFRHILDAFHYGVPPHGGIALGIDRLVAILQNEPNIREVIAFPKTGDGRDLMMNAPSEVDKKQLDELHLKITK